MPLHPADFFVRKFAPPSGRRFRTDLREISSRCRVTAPELTHFCRRQDRSRIETDLEISANFLHRAGRFGDQLFVRHDKTRSITLTHSLREPGCDAPVSDHIISRKSPGFSCFLQRDLCCEDGTRVAHRDENFRVRKSSKNRGNVIAIRRSFFDPASDGVERALKRRCVGFYHEHKQIFFSVCGVKRCALKCFEKFLARKCGIIAFAPFAWPAEQHVGKRLFGQVIKLCAAPARRIFCENGGEIRGLFRQDEKFGMIVEQRD